VNRAEAIALSGEHFGAIVESTDDAIFSKDADGLITSWNPAAERMYGYSADEAIGKHISLLMPEHRKGEERRLLEQVFAGEAVEHYETERLTKDGRIVSVSLTVSPVRDEQGQIYLASVIGRDITVQRRLRELTSRLYKITTALSREITAERTVEVLLEQALAAFGADGGAVGLLDEAGTEVELVGTTGLRETEVARYQRFELAADNPMAEAIRTGEAVYTESAEELGSRYSGLADGTLTFAALAMVPLSLAERPIGALSLSFRDPQHFDEIERGFLAAAAQQAAHALERARLYESQRSLTGRVAFLAEASELLGKSLDPEKTMRRFADLAVCEIADWCGVELLDENGALQNVAVAHVDPEQVEMAQELRTRYPPDPDAETGAPGVTRTGKSQLYPEIPDELLAESAEDEEHLSLIKALGLESAMVVPLIARGKALGAITYVSSEPGRRYGQEDLELAEDLARRAALAIDNSMLFHREHEAAVRLQRALLPESLPQVDGIEFAAHYAPAEEGLEVGGDFYEAIALEDGSVSVTIGDVAGRGIRAAAVMGRARTALRAYVLDGHPPAAAIRRVDRLLRESGRPELITMFHLGLEPATGHAEYVRAGHLPGLLRLPDGEVRELAGTGTPPLGIFERIDYEVHTVEVPAGSLLLLYTDGLIERRDGDLRAAMVRLGEVLAAGPDTAEECLQNVLGEFQADDVPDDVAILVMGRT
jgi:PAS domain S-box-containing protein